MAIDLGDVYRLSLRNLSAAGAPVNATGTVSATVILPDGSTAGPFTAINDTTGLYHYDYLTTTQGRHLATWSGPGVNPQPDAFDVRPANPRYIISLADAKAQLNMTLTEDDEELRGYLEAVTDILEEFTDKVIVRRTIVEERNLGTAPSASPTGVLQQFTLNCGPVLSLTSIASATGVGTWSVSDMRVTGAGVVEVLAGSPVWGPVTVTYEAGMVSIPANFSRAAAETLQHLWLSQRGSQGAPLSGIGQPAASPAYALPYRVQQMLGANPSGIA